MILKQRIISAMGALVVLAVALYLFDTPLFNLMISIICMLGVYEFFMAADISKHKSFLIVCIVFTGVVPFITSKIIRNIFPIIFYVFFIILFFILLKHHNTIGFKDIAFGFFASTFMALSLTTAAIMKAEHGSLIGLLYVCTALGGAWISDTGAYFVGIMFGKHKMAPEISPKKTIEGAIGGVVAAEIFLLILGYGFGIYAKSIGVNIFVDYPMIIVLAPIISVLGILGDLSASIIKRQCHIKDFGSIMPGHGGVLDRFDSVLFIMPAVYIISRYMPLYLLV